jgi:hypothetical protein
MTKQIHNFRDQTDSMRSQYRIVHKIGGFHIQH